MQFIPTTFAVQMLHFHRLAGLVRSCCFPLFIPIGVKGFWMRRLAGFGHA